MRQKDYTTSRHLFFVNNNNNRLFVPVNVCFFIMRLYHVALQGLTQFLSQAQAATPRIAVCSRFRVGFSPKGGFMV